MKITKAYIFLCFFLVSNLVIGQGIVDYSECNQLKTEKERQTSYANGGSSNSWCDIGNTEYTRCMCSKEREERKEIEARQEAENQLKALQKRNYDIWQDARIILGEASEIELELGSVLSDEFKFNSVKSRALSRYKAAVGKLNTVLPTYAYCMRMDPRNKPTDCDRGLPYQQSRNDLMKSINDLEKREYVPEITITLSENNSEGSSDSNNSSSNNESNNRNTNNQTKTNNYKPELTSQQLRNEANSMVVTKNYEQYYKSEKLKRAQELEELENLTKYNTSYSNSSSNTKYQQDVAIAQASVALLTEVFRVNPAAQRQRENQRRMNYERREFTKDRVKTANKGLYKEELMSDFSSNLAVKKNKKGWYGFVNKEGEWVVKPKYLFAEPFNNGKAEVTTKVGKKYYINLKGEKL